MLVYSFCLSSRLTGLTGAVFGNDSISVEAWGTDLTLGTSRVVHAALALARQRVAVTEQHVGVSVVMAPAGQTRATNHHGVSIETRSTPGVQKYCEWVRL